MNLKLSRTALRELTRLYRGVLFAALISAAFVASGAKANTNYTGSAVSWSGTELLQTSEVLPEGVVVEASAEGSNITVTAKNWDSEASSQWSVGRGTFTNMTKVTESQDALATAGFTMNNSSFTDNEAAYSGGAATLWSDGSAVATPLTNNINNSSFTGNTAELGGAIATMPMNAFVVKDNLNISNSTFTGNHSTSTATGGYSGGGAMFLENVNLAVTGTSAFDSNISDTVAGAVNVQSSTAAEFNGTTFTKNTAATNGGAIYNEGSVTLTGATFGGTAEGAGNTAGGNGGAIYSATADAVTTIKDSTFTGNKTTGSSGIGGAMYVYSGTADIDNTTFEGNSATWGGAVYTKARIGSVANTSDLTITNSEFNNNTANGVGAVGVMRKGIITNTNFTGNSATDSTDDGAGALFLGAESYTTLTGGKFDTNTSASSGGAIGTRDFGQGDNTAAKLDINGTTFEGNVAATTGGAIDNYFYNDANNDGYAKVSNSTFTANQAANGGAIYNHADDTQTGSISISDSSFEGNTATTQGGAIFNYGTLTVDGSTFTGNKTTATTFPSQGGAIFNSGDYDYLDVPAITANISNTTFGDKNDATKGNQALQGGAIANESDLIDGEVTLTNVNFYNNKAFADTDGSDGYVSSLGGAIWNQGVMTVNGDTEFKGNTAEGYNVEGGAIYNSGSLTFNDEVTFDSNTATDKNSGNGAFGGALSTSWTSDTTFKKAATFTGNKALSTADKGTQGGAIFNGNELTFENGATFSKNEAVYGGAIFNEDGTLSLTDATFTNNTAGDEGGAIFNYGGTVNINAANSDVVFSGNTANGEANDITNYYGTINLDAADGKTISLAGGIDGVDGAVKVTGAGTGSIEVSSIKNQTVTVSSGELHLIEADLTDSTVAVGSGATINTIDDVINDYSSTVTLGNGAIIKGDLSYEEGKADKYGAASGANVTYKLANALDTGVVYGGPKTIQVAATGSTVNKDASFAFVNTEQGLTLTGGEAGTGTVVVEGIAGGIEGAADASATNTETEYNLTGDDSLDNAKTFQNNVIINGAGTGSTDPALTLNNDLNVASGANVEMNNLNMDVTSGNAFTTQDGGTTEVNNSNITGEGAGSKFVNEAGATTTVYNSYFKDLTIDNAGIWNSDPTTYDNVIKNNTGVATFDTDVFKNGSVLNNTSVANFISVDFQDTSYITGNGTVNLVSGTSKFNDTSMSNTLNVANGADFTGTIAGTAASKINTQNGAIAALSGAVSSGNLYVDATVNDTTYTIDTFTDASGATLKGINLLSSTYGTYNINDKVTIDLNGATVDPTALELSGAANYYTKASVDGSGNLVLSDKLVNTSAIQGTGDTTTPAGDVVIGSVADTTTMGAKNAKIALDNTAETATVTAANGLVISDGATTPNTVTLTATASGLDVADGLTVGGTAYGINSTGVAKLNGLTVGTTAYGIDNAGAGALASLTVGGENVLTAADVGPNYTHVPGTSTLADVTSYVGTNGTKLANVASTAGLMTTLLDDKQNWVSQEFGYDTKTTDANTVLTAAGYSDQNSDGKVGFLDAFTEIKTDTTVTTAGTYITTGSDVAGNLGALDTAVKNSSDDVADIRTALGIADGDTDTTITGAKNITDNATFKGALTELDTAIGDRNYVTSGGYTGTLLADGQDVATSVLNIANNMVSLTDDNVFTGVNTFKNASGIAIKDAFDNITTLKTEVSGSDTLLTVSSTVNAAGLRLGTNTVTSIDVNGSGVGPTSGGSDKVMATAATVYNGAEKGLYTGSMVTGTATGTYTIKDAIDATTDALNAVLTSGGNEIDSAKVDVQWNSGDSTLKTVLGTGAYTNENNVTSGQSITASIDALDTAVGDVSTLTTTATDVAGAINEVVGDITVGAGTYNYIAAGADVAGNLVALDTQVKANSDSLALVGTAQTSVATGGLLDGYAISGDGAGTSKTLVQAVDTIAHNAAGLSLDNTFSGNNTFTGTTQFNGATNTFGATAGSQVVIDNGGNITVDGNTTTGTLTVGSANAISSTSAGVLNMNNSLTGIVDLTMTGDASIGGDATIGGDLGVAGDASVAGDLGVTGTATVGALAIGATGYGVTSTGAATLGATTVDSLNIGATGKGFDASGNATTGTLTVGAANAITGTAASLDMGANALTNVASITTTGDATIGGDLGVAGDAVVAGDFAVTGDTVLADTTVGGDLSVAGDTSLADTTVTGTLTVTDGTTANTFAMQGKTVTVDGNTEHVLQANGDVLSTGIVAAANGLIVAKQTGTDTYSVVFDVDDNGSIVSDMFNTDNVGNTVTIGKTAASATDVVGDFTLNGTTGSGYAVNDIDGTGLARGAAGVANTLATSTSVVATIAAQAEDATYTNAILTGSNITAGTLGGAIGDLDTVIGDFANIANANGNLGGADVSADLDALDVAIGNRTYTNDYIIADGQDITTSLDAIDTVIGDYTNLSNAKGNLTGTDLTSDLDALDVAIGDRTYTNGYNITSADDVTTSLDDLDTAIGTRAYTNQYNITSADDVTKSLDDIDTAIGDRTAFSNTVAVDYSTTGLNGNDVVGAISQVASNIGSAGVTGANGNVVAGNTVNQNLDSLDAAIGDRSQLGQSNYMAANETIVEGMMDLDHNLKRVEKEMRGGFASMAAMSALVPNARAAGNTQLSMGVGAYRDHQGIAIGGFHYFNDNILANVGASYGGDKSAVFRAGVTFGW